VYLLVSVFVYRCQAGAEGVSGLVFLLFFLFAGLCAYVHCYARIGRGGGRKGSGVIVVKCKLERDMHFDSFDMQKLMTVLS